jgi:hypothetical protein
MFYDRYRFSVSTTDIHFRDLIHHCKSLITYKESNGLYLLDMGCYVEPTRGFVQLPGAPVHQVEILFGL